MQASAALRSRPAPDRRQTAAGQPRRSGAADLIRAVAVVLVVLIHAASWANPSGEGGPFYSDLMLLARVALPLFVILSGYLLGRSWLVRGADQRFWWRRIRRTLLPWTAWAVVYFWATVGLTGMSPDPARTWGWWAGGAGHLYFLLLIPQLYLLMLLWPRGGRRATVALAACLLIQVGLQLTRVMVAPASPVGAVLLNYGFEFGPLWIGYFALGLWAAPRLRELRWPLWGGAVTWCAVLLSSALLLVDPLGLVARSWGPWVGGTGGFLRPSLLPLSVSLWLGLWWAAPRLLNPRRGQLGRGVESVSRHALGIYIIHPLFLFGLGPLLEDTPRPLNLHQTWPGSLLPVLVLAAFALGAAWASSALLQRFRPTAWAIGEPARSQMAAS